MLTRSEIVAQIASLQSLLARYDAVPEDIFNLGTIVRLAYNNNQNHWHLLKTSENKWKYLGTGEEKSLPEWVIGAVNSNLGYFELYILSPDDSPIFVNNE